MPVLSTLPAPDVIEVIDYEKILAERKADLIARDTSLAAVLAVESEPLTKLLEESAYRETLLRQRINDASASLLLAKSAGADLDHIAFTYYNNTTRLLVAAGDANAVPPIPAVYESDDRLRNRCRLALYAYSTAGSTGAYKFHAMTASADVKDVFVAKHTPAKGDVTLYVLSATGDGLPAQAVLDAVQIALSDETVRPLNDTPFVQAAAIVNWTLDATLTVFPDANTTLVLTEANASATAFASEHHALDHDITIAALDAALMVPGVQDVSYAAPLANLVISSGQAAFNTAISIAIGATSA